MVSTRGHRDNDQEDKTSQPSRECRKSNTTMEEPEDEMFWESDVSNKGKRNSASVSFKEEDISRTEHVKEERNTRESPEAEKSLELTDEKEKALKKRSNATSDHVAAPEESESEDEIFRTPKITKQKPIFETKTRDNKSHAREMSNEEEAISDHEAGLRRSSRKRTFQHYYSEASWLVGDKKVKGYPNMINSSEPENEEPRAARKSRYIQSNKRAEPRRRSQRFSDSNLQRGSRRTRRYENQSDKDETKEDDEDCDIYAKRYLPSRKTTSSNRQSSRPRRHHHGVVRYEEQTENTEDDAMRFHPKTRHLRSSSAHTEKTHTVKSPNLVQSSDSEDKEEIEEKDSKEDDDVKDNDQSRTENSTKRSSRNRRSKESVIMERLDKDSIIDVPMKRQRKPVSRLMYEAHPSHSKTFLSTSRSASSNSDDEEEEDPSRREGKARYSLRQNRKPLHMQAPFEESSHRHKRKESLASYLHSPARKAVFTRRHRAAHGRTEHSSSSSSEEGEFEKRKAKSMSKARNRCLPVNLKPEDLQLGGQKERKVGSSLADVDPMSMDRSITFESIGGLAQHVKALKEMILFPILYPEVFQKFSVQPPRGVLFYGPPGTGKTLVARALANECSVDDRKVAFFMRKGADCLSKWVGESERQLRLLFDQAYQMRPSIIFFDEIDGLAPVRSSRQDQIHSSIVSTLLALLDGIDSRGEIVIIGATNRIDAIDPALRRPGRFDREFHFPLPSVVARNQILKIHTKKWDPLPSEKLLKNLSERTVGYCGADLKALCAESTLVALRTQFPQIYNSHKKLLIDASKIQIKQRHFETCLAKIVPAGQRAASSPGRKLDPISEPLLGPTLKGALASVRNTFPHGFTKLTKNCMVHRPRLLVAGKKSQGQTTLLAPAMIHAMERLPSHKLDFPSLFSVSARAPEEACAQVFHQAKLTAPSILYVPLIDNLWSAASDTIKSTFTFLLNDMESSVPVILLATSSTPYVEMEREVQQLFSIYQGEVFVMSNPHEERRRLLYKPLFFNTLLLKPFLPKSKKAIDELPLAPPPKPRELKDEEISRLEEVEEASLRELRIFLRQICAKLAKNKMFYIFTKPVDLDEVPDYLEVISQPMDLETMMTKIDLHKYECAQDFVKDIEQIVSNALEYNPDRNPEDKLIRHRACTLRDTAYAYIKAEMDTDFEEKCRDIRNHRKKRHRAPSRPPHFLALEQTLEDVHKDTGARQVNEDDSEGEPKKTPGSRKKRSRVSNWCKGIMSKKRKLDSKSSETNGVDSSEKLDQDDEQSKDKTTDSDVAACNGAASNEDSQDTPTDPTNALASKVLAMPLDQLETSAVLKLESPPTESVTDTTVDRTIVVDRDHLASVFEFCISATEDCTVDELRYLYSVIFKLAKKHRSKLDKNLLLRDVESEIRRFSQCQDHIE